MAEGMRTPKVTTAGNSDTLEVHGRPSKEGRYP
jgi:hypothetical protein